MLDAAKTNRAVSLYRAQSTLSDLLEIARTLFPSIAKSPTSPLGSPMRLKPKSYREESLTFIESFLHIYVKNMSRSFQRFYGIRDVVHFLLYLYRAKEDTENAVFSPKAVVEALERNFNGRPGVLESLIKEILKQV